MDRIMSDLDKITAFLNNLSAISQVHYQIWSPEASLIFSTQAQNGDALTNPVRLALVKKILKKKTYVYGATERNRFLCGLPISENQRVRGIVLASGAVPEAGSNGAHPKGMKFLLNQVLMLGNNGTPAHRQPESVSPEPADHSFEDIYLFANISKQFRSLRLKQPVMDKLMQRILTTMDADAAFLHFPDHPELHQLNVRPDTEKGPDSSGLRQESLQKVIIHCIEHFSGNYLIIDNSTDDERVAALSERPFRFMAVTVRYMKKSYGLLGLVSYDVRKGFRRDELNIMQTLANQLAAMMANMERYDELERFTVNIVCSLVNAIETKDTYFRGHSKRVHRYAMQMARHLNMPAEEMEALKWAAVLHDIGKIGIPERILCKPGKLTENERDLIKQHPMKGKTILEPIRQLRPSMDAIAYHHENYNGTGYPEGLKGEAIPLTARIIAVADTFDALTSQRSYREPKAPRKALQVMEQVAGTRLDPHLVQVFKKSCRQFINRTADSGQRANASEW
jgi:putative nucleotidyltransferase with HDIG domain